MLHYPFLAFPLHCGNSRHNSLSHSLAHVEVLDLKDLDITYKQISVVKPCQLSYGKNGSDLELGSWGT